MEDNVVELRLAISDSVVEKLYDAQKVLLEVMALEFQPTTRLQIQSEIRKEADRLNMVLARYLRFDDLRWRMERKPQPRLLLPDTPKDPPRYQ